MAGENLSFDIWGHDHASGSFRSAAAAASDMGGKMDLAAKGSYLLQESLKKSKKAADTSVGATLALAKSAKILADAEHVLRDGALEADFALERLGKRKARPSVGLDGFGRTMAEIAAADAGLDELGKKASGGSGSGGIFGKIMGLFAGGSGGAASGGSNAASSGSGLLSSPGGIALAAGGAGLGAALVPGIVGAGIGGGVGLGAITGGLFGAAQGKKVLAADLANIKQITTGLKTAIGQQKVQLSASLQAANKQYAKDSAFYAPFTAFQKSLTGLAQVVLKPLRGIMAPLAGIFTQFGKGLTALAPQLTAMFKASLPFIRQFATVMLQSGKTLIPAFTQAMNTMVKSGALKIMTQGLVVLVQGLAGFIKALGPGMKPSAQLFLQITKGIKGLLIGLGVTFSWIARVIEFVPSAAAARLRHGLFATFNGIRHETAVIFDGVRHDIAHTWDQIWNNTIGRVQRGISDTVKWFKGLPGRAVGALFGLGHSLAAFASAAIGQMWTGFRNTFSAVIHWFTGLPKMILHALGIHSPPGWAISAGKHIMAGLHIGLGHGLGQLTSFTTGIGAKVAAGLSGALGGAMGDSGARTRSAAVAQAYARSLLSMYGWSQSQMSSLIPLWNQESGWNAWAVNPSSGAYGIPQSLGHGHPYNLGDYKNQIVWGLNYIRGRYGSPGAAWGHEQAFNWYGSGTSSARPGWAVVGERGAELVKMRGGEQVRPVHGRGGGGGEVRHVIEFRAAPGHRYGQFLMDEIQKLVTVSGGGDVQVAFGRKA